MFKSIIKLIKSKIQKQIKPDKSICSCNSFYYHFLYSITVMFHNYVHVEMEVDNQPNIWVCSQRAIQRKQISRHLILFHNDSRERYDRRQEIKYRKKYSILFNLI